MPRYGDPDYDPDYDDSPPPSPKARTFQNVSSYSTTRLLARRLWRSRSVILTLGLIVGTIYLWTKVRHSVGRVSHEPSLSFTNVNWKLYAYTQYATDGAHLCNALMVFEALHRLGSKAQRILIYPDSMDTEIKNGRDRDGQLLNMAMRKYNVKLVPMKLEAVMKAYPHKATLSTTDRDQIGWDRSINKMLAFNQTDFLRVIHLDNDIVLYKHLDDLFLLPSTTVAMTRAYWLDEDQLPIPKGVVPEPQLEHGSGSPFLSTHLMVIEPSVLESARIWQEIEKAEFSPAGASMDFLILNKLYKEIAMVLPHRSLALRTGEFRRSPADHEAYLGMSSKIVSNITNKILTTEKWDNLRILREARLVHFSGDEPLPKPWIMWPPKLYRLIRPKCAYMDGTPLEADCEDREVWAKIYEGFRKKRKTVCALLMIPAPYWQPVEAEEPDVSKEEHS